MFREDFLASLTCYEWKQVYTSKNMAAEDLPGFKFVGDGWYRNNSTSEVLLVIETEPTGKYTGKSKENALIVYKFSKDPRTMMNEIMGKLLMLPVLL